jgi:hypothetical protein
MHQLFEVVLFYGIFFLLYMSVRRMMKCSYPSIGSACAGWYRRDINFHRRSQYRSVRCRQSFPPYATKIQGILGAQHNLFRFSLRKKSFLVLPKKKKKTTVNIHPFI